MASNLAQRTITGLIAGSFALVLTVYHPYSFLALLLLVTILSMREWLHLGKHLYPTNPTIRLAFAALFAPYFAPALIALAWLRWPDLLAFTGYEAVLGLFALVWTTDIAAYACGRLIGGPRIAPAISPNKTWAGLLGAVICTAAMAALLASKQGIFSPMMWIYGGLLAIAAQAGDFFESYLKRRAGLKDSGTLLPGHGGILDRIDGLIIAAPFYALILSHAVKV